MKVKSESKSLSRVQLLATPWTAAYQVPPSMDFPGKSTVVGCHYVLGNPKIYMFALLQYPLCCGGLEPKLKYLWAVPALKILDSYRLFPNLTQSQVNFTTSILNSKSPQTFTCEGGNYFLPSNFPLPCLIAEVVCRLDTLGGIRIFITVDIVTWQIKQFSDEFNSLDSGKSKPWIGGIQCLTNSRTPFLRYFG